MILAKDNPATYEGMREMWERLVSSATIERRLSSRDPLKEALRAQIADQHKEIIKGYYLV